MSINEDCNIYFYCHVLRSLLSVFCYNKFKIHHLFYFHHHVFPLFLHSNPEYKDTPIDIVQLPNPPEKTSESSESSDSESESKENSGMFQSEQLGE